MTKMVLPGSRTGTVKIPASKSQAHRLLICAALSTDPVRITCDGLSNDILATICCLNALGATVTESSPGVLDITPLAKKADVCHLPCGESGSTLRFLLPLVGALGQNAVFHMEGRLPQRPLAPLDQLLQAHGMTICQQGNLLFSEGNLEPGCFTIPGNISSQYISGLLFALPLLEGDSILTVTGEVESEAYIAMTENALQLAGIRFSKTEQTYQIPGKQTYHLPHSCPVEGDYSNAAFFLCAGAFSQQGITVQGLCADSLQGDRAVLEILQKFGAQISCHSNEITVKRGDLHGIEIDAAPIPDLIPVLSVVAAVAAGKTRILRAGRLRLKESDRLASTSQMLNILGANVTELEDGLIIQGKPFLCGGMVPTWNDHRIAMSAAVAAGVCSKEVQIQGSRCVEKSYPRFWEDLEQLKGEHDL